MMAERHAETKIDSSYGWVWEGDASGSYHGGRYQDTSHAVTRDAMIQTLKQPDRSNTYIYMDISCVSITMVRQRPGFRVPFRRPTDGPGGGVHTLGSIQHEMPLYDRHQ